MTRYAKKPDGNHKSIKALATAIPGLNVIDTSGMPGLGCDLLCSYQDGPLEMIEIKRDGKATLTDSEKRARRLFPGHWHRVETQDELLAVFGLETGGA
jgi:hypothetical protein